MHKRQTVPSYYEHCRAADATTIQHELFTTPLEDQVNKLTALSYISGPPESKSFITANSVEYKVRQNLKHFLSAIRQRYKKSLAVGVYSIVHGDE